jgi:hypothetical protein
VVQTWSDSAARRFFSAPSGSVSAAAVTFADEFDGPAGSGVNSSRWTQEAGDNVNNHERQYYTSGTNNAALDGQGHLVITAKRENPGNYNCWYGRCECQDVARPGHVAGALPPGRPRS